MSTQGDHTTLAVFILALLAWLLFPGCTTMVKTKQGTEISFTVTAQDFKDIQKLRNR